jgi:hypothetical protein
VLAYIHLNFLSYAPKLMERKDDYFTYFVMCPPGETLYFYTINGELILQPGTKKNCLLEVHVRMINRT